MCAYRTGASVQFHCPHAAAEYVTLLGVAYHFCPAHAEWAKRG